MLASLIAQGKEKAVSARTEAVAADGQTEKEEEKHDLEPPIVKRVKISDEGE